MFLLIQWETTDFFKNSIYNLKFYRLLIFYNRFLLETSRFSTYIDMSSAYNDNSCLASKNYFYSFPCIITLATIWNITLNNGSNNAYYYLVTDFHRNVSGILFLRINLSGNNFYGFEKMITQLMRAFSKTPTTTQPALDPSLYLPLSHIPYSVITKTSQFYLLNIS